MGSTAGGNVMDESLAPTTTAPTVDHGAQPVPVEDYAQQIFNAVELLFQTRIGALEGGLSHAVQEQERLEAENVVLRERLNGSLAGRAVPRGPKVHAPEVYDGKDRDKADQYLRQIVRAARFETFVDDAQRILWAESYLTGQAHTWSSVITGDASTVNPLRDDWNAWSRAFSDTFCTREPAREAYVKLSSLHQGSKTITAYTTEFRELVSRLPPSEQTGFFINGRYWDGLNPVAKQALVNTDYTTAAEAQDILLRRESRLADIAAQQKSTSGHSSSAFGRSSAPTHVARAQPAAGATPTPPPRPAQFSAPAPSRDPNAMEVDAAKSRRTCYKCGKTGHLKFECPDLYSAHYSAIRAAVVEDLTRSGLLGPAPVVPGPPAPSKDFV